MVRYFLVLLRIKVSHFMVQERAKAQVDCNEGEANFRTVELRPGHKKGESLRWPILGKWL